MKSLKTFLLLSLTLTNFSLAAKKKVDSAVVVVNDEIILESDIAEFRKKLKSKSFQELFGGLDPAVAKKRESIIQLLVEERLIDQYVKKLDLAANDEEIDAQIRAITKRNGISKGQLNERLRQLGSNLTEYRKGIKRQLERKNLIDREIKPDLKISDEHLRHYHQRASGQEDSGSYRIAHVFLRNKKGAKSRANTIYEEIKSNKISFEQAAKDYSDDGGSSSGGGDLGFLSHDSLSKEFQKTVPKTPVGQITPPIKTGSGYHIVKVIEKKNSSFSDLPAEEKERLRSSMYAEELEKRMLLWLERKKKESYIRVVSN